jgi:hypothetical protein
MTWLWDNNSTPVTAILDEDGEQLFETAKFLSVQVGESKTFSTHTLENGQVVADNAIDNQDRINLQLVLDPDDYIETYAEIQTLFDSYSPISIQTRVDTYENLYIEAMPHDEGPAMANTISININLVEQQIVSSTTQVLTISDVDSTADVSTVKSGQKSSTESETVLQSLFGGFL